MHGLAEQAPRQDRVTYQDLNAFRLPAGFRGRPAWIVQLWWLVQGSVFRYSPQFMYGWRRWLLRCFGARVGRKVLVRPTVRVTYPWKVSIGDYSWIGDDVVLYSLGEIEIGSNAVVSQRSYICTGGHDHEEPAFSIFSRKVVIEDESWVATDVFVAPGVVIGAGAVIGARSSVFSNMPAGQVCLGSPARPSHARRRAGKAGRG